MDLARVCYSCFQEKPDDSPVCPYCGFSSEEEQPFLALPMGTVLHGRYLMGRVLGVGGFGITYLGYDMVLEIRVAVKEYMPSGLAVRHADRYRVVLAGRRKEDYENGLDRFLEEARILAKLQGTPNIVSVQDYFTENSTAYFVMEYVDGMSLKAYLASQGGKIPCAQALAILKPVMEALEWVHGLGLTHRDISPDNISITSGGESKLLDFGAARFSSQDDQSVSVILKHGFAPEEQYSSHGSFGPWTDVYAMGATLYRCVTGQLPPDAIERVRRDTLKKPSELGVSLPSNVEAATMKAMAVKAEDRFPSMADFLCALTATGAGTAFPKIARGKTGFRHGNPGTEKGGILIRRPQKAFVLKLAALAATAALTGVGVWRLLPDASLPAGTGTSGLPASTPEPGSSMSTPESSVPEPENSGSSESENGMSEPGGSTQPALADYANEYLNLSMTVPSDFQETSPGSAVFVSPDGSCSLQVGFYTCWSGFPVYSLADVEANAEQYAGYFIGLLQSTEITGYEILDEGYRQAGGADGYQVEFQAAESGGSVMRFLAVFIEGQNGFGCYNLIASYPQEDTAVQQKLLSAVDSFRCLGPAGTGYQLFTDEKLPFKFMYAQQEPAFDFQIEDDILTATSITGSDYFVLTVSALPLAGGETAVGVLGQSTAGLDTIFPGIRQLGGQQTLESGGMEWAVQDYVHQSEGVDVYLSYAVSIWEDRAYLIIFTSSQEAQLADNGLKSDIMGSLRPVT